MCRSIVEGRLEPWKLRKDAENRSVGLESMLAESVQKN